MKGDLEISEVFTLVNKYSISTLVNRDDLTLEYFLFEAVKYVMISLRKILKPKQYEDLVKIIEAEKFTYIVPIENLKLSFEDYLVKKYSVNDITQIKKIDLWLPHHLFFFGTVLKFLPEYPPPNILPEYPRPILPSGLRLRTILLSMLLWAFVHLLHKLLNNDFSSIWKDTYQIGLLQGQLGLVESTVDPELIAKHHREKSGKGPQKYWDNDRKTREQEKKPIVDEIKKMYLDIVETKKETIPHNQITDYIHGRLVKKYPEEDHLRELILSTIRPMARERGLLRGVPHPDFLGTVVEVDSKARLITVKNDVEEKTFFVSKGGGRGIQLADLKGMNVSVTYRIERGRIVARAINVTGPARLPQKNTDEKPVAGPKK